MTTPNADTTVYTSVQGDKFHESKDCAADVSRRIECDLREAVEAQRWPCGNCVSDELRDAFQTVLSEVSAE